MKHGTIVWFIEHVARELDVACIVSVLLKKKYGKTIKILPYGQTTGRDLARVKPDMVLLPFCYGADDPGLIRILSAWPDATYINLSWEQIFYQANIDYKAPRDTFAKEGVLHHVWSKERSQFLQQLGVPEKQIFVNGHPAFALYQKPYNDLFIPRRELASAFGLDTDKRWLFFHENYSWFFYSDHNIREIIKKGQNKDTAYEMRAYCGKAFTEVMHWLQNCVRTDTNLEIILRPRPTFTLSYFLKKLHQIAPSLSGRIRIIKDYTVREWILASDVVVSSFSTSLIEAAVAQKPVYMLLPFPLPTSLEAQWYHLVPTLTSAAALKRSIPPTPHVWRPLHDWAKKEFIGQADPITGLVHYLKDPKRTTAVQRSVLANVLVQSQKNSWEQIAMSLYHGAGRVKRTLINTAAYYGNDDASRYEGEIKKKIAHYNRVLSA